MVARFRYTTTIDAYPGESLICKEPSRVHASAFAPP
jgi:hypothetical protein